MRRLRHVLLTLGLAAGCGQESQDLGGSGRSDAGVDGGSGQPDAAGFPDGSLDGGPPDAEPPATQVRFDVDDEASFFAFPFPSDAFRTPEGGVDLQHYPNPFGVALVGLYVDTGQRVLDGFGINPPVYFAFDGPIDEDSVTPLEQTLSDASNVVLVNVDPTSPELNRRHAIRPRVWSSNDGVYLDPNTLSLTPVFSMPLREGTTYAAYVTRGVLDGEGAAIGPPSTLTDALDGRGDLAQLYSPLAAWLQEQDIDPADIAAATIFTTGRPTESMSRLADFVRNEADSPMQIDVGVSSDSFAAFTLYEGSFTSPNFQTGTKPYAVSGGSIVFDDQGAPIVQATETIRFALAVPPGAPPPDGWPVVLYGHGTGGDYRSFVRSGPQNPAARLAALGIASMGIDQPLHGARSPPDALDDVELNSFNVSNPDSFRSVFRQGAADIISQWRFVRESLEVTDGNGARIPFDTARIAYLGHSQGGLSGTIVAPYLPELRAVVLSAPGGGITDSVLLRKTLGGRPFDFAGILSFVARISNPDELDRGHPLLGLVQMIVDATDPIAFAFLNAQPPGDNPPADLLMTEGLDDPITPPITTDNLAAAAGLPILAPVGEPSLGHVLRDIPPVTPPVVANLGNPFGTGTGVLARFSGQDHFAIFDSEAAADRVYAFLASAMTDQPPRIDP